MRNSLVNRKYVFDVSPVPEKPYAIQIVNMTNDVPFATTPLDNINLECGYLKRLAGVTVSEEYAISSTGLYEQLALFVHEFLISNFEPLPCISNYEELFSSWLQNLDFPMYRKRQYMEAFQDLSAHSYQLSKKDYNCKSFVKREFYEEEKYPRFINSRMDKFKVLVGPFIKLIEEEVYKLRYFVKGLNYSGMVDRLKSLQKMDYIIETDYSSFESCFSLNYCQCVEIQLWKYMLSENPLILNAILSSYYDERGRSRYQKCYGRNYDYWLEGVRLSGEMWTSLGNGFSNLMNMMYLCKINNIEYDGVVEGDDGLFYLNSNKLGVDDFRQLGFRIKINYVNNLEETKFCGVLFAKTTEHLLLPPEQLARLPWTLHTQYFNSRYVQQMGLLKAKALSLYQYGPHTPILGKLCYKLIKRLEHVKVTSSFLHKYGKFLGVLKYFPDDLYEVEPALDDRLLYAETYGISLTQQYICEDIIRDTKDVLEIKLPFEFLSSAHFCYVH